MATKWRNLGTSIVTKIILFVLFVTFSFFTLRGFVSVYSTAYQGKLPIESLTEMEYTESHELLLSQNDILSALYWKYDIAKLYNIKSIPTLYYRAEYADGSVSANVDKGADFFKAHRVHGIYRVQPDGNWERLSNSGKQGYLHPDPISYGATQIFEENHYGYCRWDNGTTLPGENAFTLPIPHDLPDAVAERIYGEGPDVARSSPEPRAEEAVEKPLSDSEKQLQYDQWLAENPIPQATLYYAFDDASLAAYEAFWQQCRYYYINQIGYLLGLGLVALFAAIWLLVTCGRRPGDTEVHLLPTDRLWSELTLTLEVLALFGFAALFFVGLDSILYDRLFKDLLMIDLYCAGVSGLAAVVLLLTMSLFRLLKAHRLIKNSLTFRCCYRVWLPCTRLWDRLRSCFDERAFKDFPLTKALQRRQMVFFGTLGGALLLLLLVALAAGSGAVVALIFLLLLVLGGLGYWQMKGNIKTYEEINEGFSESFQEQMKSERTKTALITNVSHDLKTPLTSIITYVELLEKEELSDTARDYVLILAQKSQRLKQIVADLFDLSKSASGNISLDLEVLDLKRLIEQTMADMRDNIDSSGLTLKTKLPEGEVNIYSDGKKLYRVFQNIIDNALKYSMAGTRVFITLEVQEGTAVATVKNTAGYEMDFTAEEVLQRFSRGDKSRSGDGSGLGLSIAESFTHACDGDFKVELDGDLFKVTLSFKLTDLPKAE